MNDELEQVFDLDAAAAEAGIVPRTMHFAGKEWPMPADIPLAVGQCLAVGDFDGAIDALFGDDADAILGENFGMKHLEIVVTQLYGITPGESPASSASSNRATRRSRPTSRGTTR